MEASELVLLSIGMKLHYKLNLPTNPIKENIKWPEFGNTKINFANADSSILTDELLNWFDDVNLAPDVLLLMTPPMTSITIHSDGGRNDPPLCAINWSIFVTNYKMQWFKVNETPPVTKGDLVSKTAYEAIFYKEDNCTLIDETSDVGPVLVNNVIPHRAVNLENKTRWCVSIRINPRFKTWESAVDFFKPWIV
jgi:hypothetical protein